jgi:hypothetical protein
MSSFGQRIRPFVQAALDAARHARARRDAEAQFICLNERTCCPRPTRGSMSVCMPRCCFGEYASAARVKSSVKPFGLSARPRRSLSTSYRTATPAGPT